MNSAAWKTGEGRRTICGGASLPLPRQLRLLALQVAALMALAVGDAAHAATPVYREFKDWIVGCDNVAHCEAYGGGEANDLLIYLERDAGLQGALKLELNTPDARLTLANLRVDGHPLVLDAKSWKRKQTGPGEYVELSTQDPAAALAFLDAVRGGSALSIASGEATSTGSLAGLSAVLLLIDDTQGRIGTRTALLRRGDKPDGTVPVAPALPQLPLAPSMPSALTEIEMGKLIALARQQQPGLWNETTGDCDADITGTGQAKAVALTSKEALVFLECFRGASESSFIAFRMQRQAPNLGSRLRLPVALTVDEVGDGKGHIDTFFDPDYDPKTGQLFQSVHGPGAGCGNSESWRFDGRDFHLASMFYRSSCWPADQRGWPRLWATDVVP